MTTIHVMPVDDVKEHTEEDDCVCRPKVEYVGNGNKIVIHNSFDGREFLERWEDAKQGMAQ